MPCATVATRTQRGPSSAELAQSDSQSSWPPAGHGTELVEVGEADFIYIPAHLIHRESVAAEGGEGVVVRVGGVGATVFNIEGPDPAT
jgi:hypothetical protein